VSGSTVSLRIVPCSTASASSSGVTRIRCAWRTRGSPPVHHRLGVGLVWWQDGTAASSHPAANGGRAQRVVPQPESANRARGMEQERQAHDLSYRATTPMQLGAPSISRTLRNGGIHTSTRVSTRLTHTHASPHPSPRRQLQPVGASLK